MYSAFIWSNLFENIAFGVFSMKQTFRRSKCNTSPFITFVRVDCTKHCDTSVTFVSVPDKYCSKI